MIVPPGHARRALRQRFNVAIDPLAEVQAQPHVELVRRFHPRLEWHRPDSRRQLWQLETGRGCAIGIARGKAGTFAAASGELWRIDFDAWGNSTLIPLTIAPRLLPGQSAPAPQKPAALATLRPGVLRASTIVLCSGETLFWHSRWNGVHEVLSPDHFTLVRLQPRAWHSPERGEVALSDAGRRRADVAQLVALSLASYLKSANLLE